MSNVIPPTEDVHPRSAGLDLLDTRALVETIVADQRAAVDAVLTQSETLARVVDAIAHRLECGGRLHYVGAGSSGRLGMLDAAEMPPTFGISHELVRAHIAGGADALVRAVEGAEDDAEGGAAVVDDFVNYGDVVLGISASGSAAFVDAAIERAKEKGALTIALTSYADSPLARRAEMSVILETGAEVLTGSTRLKAGTSQKIALNAISTAVMVRLNKIYDNLMVDVVATNRKLHARAIRLIQKLAEVDAARATDLLAMANGRVKTAIVMERSGVGPKEAQSLLDCHDGSLRAVLE
jgi:N-acetylmuramic acid 6-phosphate etherase